MGPQIMRIEIRHFYKPKPLRTLDEIRKYILAVQICGKPFRAAMRQNTDFSNKQGSPHSDAWRLEMHPKLVL